MTKPLVSICIPAYNSGEFIKETIESVLRQSYENIELIITDDCSKDNTVEIVNSFNDNRLKLHVNKTNKGLTGNWNESVSYAKGKYIKLLCADDNILKNCIEREVEAFENNESASIVISDTNIVNPRGEVQLRIKRFGKSGLINGKKLAKRSILFKNYFGAPCNTLFRKETIDRIGAFDENLKHIPDYDLWLRLAYEGDVYYIKETLSEFRVHNVSNTSQLMSSGKQEFSDEHANMVRKHMKLNKIKISETDLKIHTFMRNLRNFMLDTFLKYFVKR